MGTDDTTTDSTSSTTPNPKKPPLSRKTLLLALLGLSLLASLALIGADYLSSLRVVAISPTEGLDARLGTIQIKYNRPVERVNFGAGTPGLAMRSSLSDDRLTETYTLTYPTRYNRRFELVRRDQRLNYRLLGLFLPPPRIALSTGMEKIAVRGLQPAENSLPVPDAMDNQIALQFQGEVRGKYATGINITPEEMTYVRLSPAMRGYYRWVNDSLLTFNFTEDRPQFDSRYAFDVYPEKIINTKYQVWAGDKTRFELKTASNEVYIRDHNFQGEVKWQQRLRMEFSGNMVGALDVLKKKAQDVVPVDISPKAGGVWVWTNARTLEFQPDDKLGWPVRQQVTVTVHPQINLEAGRTWRGAEEPAVFRFTVLAREQSITSYNLHGEHVGLDDELTVSFSRPMVDEQALHKLFSGKADNKDVALIFEPPVEGEFYWSGRDKLKFRPDNLWSELTQYKVRLNPAFNPDTRYEWTGTREFEFKTVENVVNVGFYLTPEERLAPSHFFSNKGQYKKDKAVQTEERLWIQFDKDIGRFVGKELDLAQAVRIEPKIEGSFTWLSNGLLEFTPKDNWKENTRYRVMLEKTLLHHPQQHYQKAQNEFDFVTAENRVRSSRLSQSGGGAWRQDPDKALNIDFSKNMKTGLAIGRDYLSGQLEAGANPVMITPALEASVQWKDARNLLITPSTYWKPQTTYTITLNPALLPQNEAEFESAGKFTIKTGKNYVDLTRFTPTGVVGPRIIIDAQFNRDIKPAAATLGEQDRSELFSIEPEVKGQWVWLAKDKIQFKPTEALQQSTAYRVNFDANRIEDKQFSWSESPQKGQTAYPIRTYTFHTPALQVNAASARFEFNKQDILKQRFFLDLSLSAPVDEKLLRKHFSIGYNKIGEKGERIEVPLLYHLQTGERSVGGGVNDIAVVSDWIDRPSQDRQINYVITHGLKPVVGNLDLASDYTNFFLQEKPKHISLNTIQWRWDGRRYAAVLSFSAPIPPEDLKSALKVFAVGAEQEPEHEIDYELSVETNASYSAVFNYEIAGDFTPGQNYSFDIAEGLLAADGAFTPNPLSLASGAPDLSKQISFALSGSILSRKDLAMIPVRSTNVQDFHISVQKIYASNVDYFLNNRITDYNINDVAKEIFNKDFSTAEVSGLQDIANKEIITHIDLSELQKNNPHGLFRISVTERAGSRQRSEANSRWFLATDIGLVARRFDDNLVVWAHSLHSNEALSGIAVRVVDEWNQVIGTATSDAQGYAKIALQAGSKPAHLIASKADDFSLLDFKRHKDAVSGLDVEGVGADQSVLRSYIYSERGVYRPGDTVHLVAVSRGKEGRLPPGFAVQFKLHDPTGKESLTENYTLDQNGLFVYDYQIPAEAKTGRWRASTIWKNAVIGSYEFQVEEFIPNKIKVELELLNKSIHKGETLRFKVQANNLFGPPAAGRRVSGSIFLRANRFKPTGLSAFAFGHDDTQFQRIDEALLETTLDADGSYTYEYPIAQGIDSPMGLSLNYSATVIDDGGRGVSSYADTNVLMYTQFVGVRALSTRGPSLQTPIGFEAVNVDAQGKEIARNQQNMRIRIYRNKQLTHYRKNERGYYRYVTEKERVLVDELEDPRDPHNKFQYQPRYAGEHIVEIEDLIGGQITRLNFYVRGDERSDKIVEQADKVELKVLGHGVTINEQIELEVRSPFIGKLLLIGEREKVLFTRVLDMNTHKKTIRIPVPADYLPNFYISAIALRPVPEGDRNNPVYATGLINVEVKDPAQTPGISLQAPARAAPNGEMSVTLKVDERNAADMYYTIAAVDVGILDLTQYQVPNMEGYFNQKRRLQVDHFSMYPMVMPYEPEVKHVISPSGDAPSRALIKKKRVNPDAQKRVKSVALWSGLLKTDENGMGTVTFKIPDFDGRLRIMAVAYGDQRFASTSREVVVRDNLVMKPTLPRFLATGDDFTIPVVMFNGTDRQGDVTVRLQTSGHVKLRGPSDYTMSMAPQTEKQIEFSAQVTHELGVARVELIAEGVGERTRKIIQIPVRAPGTLASFSDGGVVDKNTPKSLVLPGAFVDGTQELAMKITSNKLAQFDNGLKYLLAYPHGCLEQTTSKLFPLLYYSDLASASGDMFSNEQTPRYYLREGIAKIERMQLENGAFSYWEGTGQVNEWAFVYAAHFMVEAKNAGLKVNNAVWNNMILQLDQLVSRDLMQGQLYARDFGVSHRLYALYVLALANENVLSHLNHLRDTYFDDLQAHDKARLAMGFASLGDEKTAKDILASISGFSAYDDPRRDTGGSFASNARDLAIILDALTTIEPSSSQIPVLVDKLGAQARYGRWGSTQENAFAFLAIGKAVANAPSMQVQAKIQLGDGTTLPFNKDIFLKTPELLKGEVRIEVSGEGDVSYAWQAVGIERDPKSLQSDEGLRVRRRFLDKDRQPVDLNKVKQGDLLVAEIKIEALGANLDNVVITDLLPMGLEIENARLSTSASLPWVKSSVTPDYVDIRDDRINLFLSVPRSSLTYFYTTRAVTVGNFKLPSIRAEAMYDPALFSEADGGQLKVLPAQGRSQFSLELN